MMPMKAMLRMTREIRREMAGQEAKDNGFRVGRNHETLITG